jgi:hypothetical protein
MAEGIEHHISKGALNQMQSFVGFARYWFAVFKNEGKER